MSKEIFNRIKTINEEIDNLKDEKTKLIDTLTEELLKNCKYNKLDIISGIEKSYSTYSENRKKSIVINSFDITFDNSFENGYGLIAIGHTVTKMKYNEKSFYKENYKSQQVKILLNEKTKIIEKHI